MKNHACNEGQLINTLHEQPTSMTPSKRGWVSECLCYQGDGLIAVKLESRIPPGYNPCSHGDTRNDRSAMKTRR